MSIFCLRAHEVETAWPKILPLIERIDERAWEPEEVKDMLMRHEALLWGIAEGTEIQAIWITKIDATRSRKWGVVWLAAGKGLEEIIEQYREHTEPYFRGAGCAFAQINGRRGWMRVLPDYREAGTIMVKEL